MHACHGCHTVHKGAVREPYQHLHSPHRHAHLYPAACLAYGDISVTCRPGYSYGDQHHLRLGMVDLTFPCHPTHPNNSGAATLVSIEL